MALERTYASTGAAVIASGVTAIAGFAVLIASDISMLRQFGISTVVDLTVALVGVLLVLPAALIFAEEHGPLRLSDLDPRPALRSRSRVACSVPRAPSCAACAVAARCPHASRSVAGVPEDRFGDLGSSGPPEDDPAKKSAAERFAELDERSPEPDAEAA